MKFRKEKLADITRCYCVSSVMVDGELHLAFASEGEGGPCYTFHGPDFSRRETVWESGGGTMSFVPVPGRENEFLATQRFFPGFKAEGAKVVWGVWENGGWTVRDFCAIPYLHRFDLLRRNGVTHFLGASLCSSKREREDWSDPGKVFTGILPQSWDGRLETRVLAQGLTKNHGYWRGGSREAPVGYVACDSGLFRATPPETAGGSWGWEEVIRAPISDVAVWDLDGDGREEYAILHPFHGDCFDLVRPGEEAPLYQYPGKPTLSHAVWAGSLNGIPAGVGGFREDDAALFVVTYNQAAGRYDTQIIEEGCGTTNVAVVSTPRGDAIAAANKKLHEAAIYYIEN